jgi:hypothetical protein
VFVKPWDEKSRKILDALTRDGRAYTTDIELSRKFGHRCSELSTLGFLDIARIERKQKTVFVTPPEIKIIKIEKKKYGLKYKFYRTF